jgi:hypothetical protein
MLVVLFCKLLKKQEVSTRTGLYSENIQCIMFFILLQEGVGLSMIWLPIRLISPSFNSFECGLPYLPGSYITAGELATVDTTGVQPHS